ncbi:Terpene cyclase ATR13 [Fulvia fulva]|uniref:Terpene cyclase ATR13 n=1 Tax=Passalora fulva TaxID=5499 RepID=A0A9Q8PDA4_PASFU|nr:Terpene cyclase ATR13 [Fulvia fulva]UJO20326.1 Terpene cyclase ATR13 [Fulvia fulva]
MMLRKSYIMPREYATLSQVLRLDIDPSRVAPENVRQKALSEVIRAAIDMDNPQASEMIQTLKTYLDSFDSRADDFDNMEEYTAYRIPNCGYWISSYFIRWGLGITLTQEDYRSIDAFDRAMGNVLGLTNGYFSWNVEKHQPTDRIRNAMRVLMKEHNIDSEAAQSMLLGIIVQEETSAAQLKQRRLQAPVSEALGQYFEAIELYVGGSCYWHATAPRYQIVE